MKKNKKRSKNMKIISWNVNGIRAIHRKGFLTWLKKEKPDILCIQETKAQENQLPFDLKIINGYFSYFSDAERKGYSGVAQYSRDEAIEVKNNFGSRKFVGEGRTLITKHKNFVLCNIYFPNGKRSKERLKYKLGFYDAFLKYAKKLLKSEKKVIVCGDFNTAHTEIDLARPKENSKISGFLPEERAWIDRFIKAGFVDCYRHLNKDKVKYTWWSQRTRARERNVGWRIDYFFISKSLKRSLKKATILNDVMGSDHCPIQIELSR